MQATSLDPGADTPANAGISGQGILPQGYSAARLTDPSGLQEADNLYRRVFGYNDPSLSLNPNLLMSLGYHGGSSVGVFDEQGDLVGYAYGFAGMDDCGEHFHFSQAAVVAPSEQGKGLGRALKVLQAREAARTGQREMRWTFDPMLVKNAHFNFDSLGAIGIDFLPNYFDRPDSDRILVSWRLPADAYANRRPAHPMPSLGRSRWGSIVSGPDESTLIPLPADPEAIAAPVREQVSERLAEALRATFDEDRMLVSCCRITDDTAAYLAVPRSATMRAHTTSARESHGKEQEQS